MRVYQNSDAPSFHNIEKHKKKRVYQNKHFVHPLVTPEGLEPSTH